MSTGRNTRNNIPATETSASETAAVTPAMTRKNTSAATRSSSTAMGISVPVTGPAVFISATMESEGAGAVARAMPPNTSAR